MPDDGQTLIDRARYVLGPYRPWAPALASGMVIGAGFLHSGFLRTVASIAAVALFLFVAADFARSLLETRPILDRQLLAGKPKKIIPVTWHQIVLTVVLAIFYSFLVFGALHLFIFDVKLPLLFLIIPGVGVLSALAAWRNV
ncbi:MAG TPA: hypothetical protein VEW69_09915, partial [Alphaproteobacteria bacterium]|nr:hypothetical protein [Alphaproteobacteria bacterium]